MSKINKMIAARVSSRDEVFTLRALITMIQDGIIEFPTEQREFKSPRSMIMGILYGFLVGRIATPIILEKRGSKYYDLDGKQRLMSLMWFVNHKLFLSIVKNNDAGFTKRRRQKIENPLVFSIKGMKKAMKNNIPAKDMVILDEYDGRSFDQLDNDVKDFALDSVLKVRIYENLSEAERRAIYIGAQNSRPMSLEDMSRAEMSAKDVIAFDNAAKDDSFMLYSKELLNNSGVLFTNIAAQITSHNAKTFNAMRTEMCNNIKDDFVSVNEIIETTQSFLKDMERNGVETLLFAGGKPTLQKIRMAIEIQKSAKSDAAVKRLFKKAAAQYENGNVVGKNTMQPVAYKNAIKKM